MLPILQCGSCRDESEKKITHKMYTLSHNNKNYYDAEVYPTISALVKIVLKQDT